MSDDRSLDLYELLQLSPNADSETIHRVYRTLAQRLHPDNKETGNESRFRELTDAHKILSDPERRAQYDVGYHRQRQDRWRLVTTGMSADNDFEAEQFARLTILEVLYTRRRMEPDEPGIFNLDLADLTGKPREHLEFTLWYLLSRGLVERTDGSRLAITAEGADHLEQHYQTQSQRRRLQASTLPV